VPLFLADYCNSQGSWINFDTTLGLPSNRARAIEVDKFDNVWVSLGSGTYGDGLAMFDGTTWTTFDTSNSDIPQNSIGIMQSDINGVLWMGFQGGTQAYLNGLTRFDGQSFLSYDTLNSTILSNGIWDIEVDSDNNLWVGNVDGISKFNGQDFTTYSITFPAGFRGGNGFVIEDSANFWIGTFGLMHYNPITDSVRIYDTGNSNIPSNYVSCIAQDANGLIWLGFDFGYNNGLGHGGTNGGLATFDGTTFTTIWPFTSIYTQVRNLTIDKIGNIWVSTTCDGLHKFDGTSWYKIPDLPLTGCSIGVDSDSQNNIWYTEQYSGVWTNKSFNSGIGKLSGSNVSIFPNPAQNVLSVNYGHIGNSMLEFSIYNPVGGLVYSRKDFAGFGREKQIDISDLTSGLYILKLRSDDEVVSEKFIIRR
jgi:ligand-binding sensor domain-containing protein